MAILNRIFIFLVLFLFVSEQASAARLKDIADIEGVRNNQLIGYGVVVGLNGTGDKKGTFFTSQSVSNLLERLGVRVSPQDLKLANVAAVVATASLPAFSKTGSRLDVTLSSIGDASTLQGGVLLMTPLKGADGKVYAVAQGPVSVGGFSVSQGGDSAQKNHPTVGLIAKGGTVEREIPFDLFSAGQVKIVLRDPDFVTITRVQKTVNEFMGPGSAKAVDSASVVVPLDHTVSNSPIELISKLEQLMIEPDSSAKVVVNERTGTIIMGENVRVSTVALAHGNLNISISSESQVSQPNALAQGQTTQLNQTELKVGEEAGLLRVMDKTVSLGELVRALNSLGATPRDLIAIFQALQRAGALQAELVIM
jgi:flagellar P-ring protein precursor FlgI